VGLIAFVIALLLLGGGIESEQGWLIALTVVTGLAALRPRPWNLLRPALDMRLGAFVLAVLLLAGTVDPTREWLIALSIVTGLAAFMPSVLRLDGWDDGGGWWWSGRPAWLERRRQRAARDQRSWERWQRRFDRQFDRRWDREFDADGGWQ
jgi:hypothetical protein